MTELRAGTPLGASYRLERRLGSGATGEAWQILRNGSTQPLVAKILHSHLATDEHLVERFVRERSVLMGLQHPHIVGIQDLVVEGKTLALIMDLVPGGSLRDLLEVSGALPPATALRVMSQVCEALAHAHSCHVVHRDVKPDNVLLHTVVHADDQLAPVVSVSDFGIASIMNSGPQHTTGIIGTPHYLAPELITRGEVGTAGDVYSAGITLYELLAGRTPFAGPGTEFSVAYRHVSLEPPRLDLPASLWGVLQDMLTKDPRERPTAAELIGRLKHLATKNASLQALPVSQEPTEVREVAAQQTVVRGFHPPAPEPVAPALPTDVPELGSAPNRTVVRPTSRPAPPPAASEVGSRPAGRRPGWLTNKVLVLLVVMALLMAVGTAGAVWWAGDTASRGSSDPVQVVDDAAPARASGLSTQRRADFDPHRGTVTLTLTYSAQKAHLRGDVLEVLPALRDGQGCPNVSWKEQKASRTQPSVTGIDADCAWTLEGIAVPANNSTQISAEIQTESMDQQQLQNWLGRASEDTNRAVEDTEVHGTSFPLQRLTSIEVSVPRQTVSQSAVPVTLLPVWPSGTDELNPLYSTRELGRPSHMLSSVAGENPVKFFDGCSGHLTVDKSGTSVTALSVAEGCTVEADVGNYTGLSSNEFSITTRG